MFKALIFMVYAHISFLWRLHKNKSDENTVNSFTYKGKQYDRDTYTKSLYLEFRGYRVKELEKLLGNENEEDVFSEMRIQALSRAISYRLK